MPRNALVVTEYLTALARSDLDHARALMHPDFSFAGPQMETTLDRDAFLADFGGKYAFVDAIRILRQVEQGAEVCTLYETDARTPAGQATLLMTEWNLVVDGRVASALLVFDTAAGARLHAAHG